MRDNRAADWLGQGKAAVRSGDLTDARFYLERALDSDANWDQKCEIWYWLSKVASDPAEQRQFLESVLAAFPGHLDARRDLAILDGRLAPEDVLDPRQAPEAVATPSPAVQRYTCPQCGGKLAYDAGKSAVTCGYCGHRQAGSPDTMPGGGIAGRDFLTALPTAKAHVWELAEARVVSCQGCGAGFALPAARMAASCPFCGSPHVVEAVSTGGLTAPDALLPFLLEAEAARERLAEWLAGQHARPRDLAQRAAIDAPRPAYLPFWAFDVGGVVSWRALQMPGANRIRGSSWALTAVQDRLVYVPGEHPVWHPNLLVAASHTLPVELVPEQEGYDLTALVPYTAGLLADWPAEVYQISMADASLVAHQRAFSLAASEIRQSTPSGEITFDSTGILIETYRLLLLPVWMLSYRYRAETYQATVNGQSGRVRAQVPRSGWQRLLVSMGY